MRFSLISLELLHSEMLILKKIMMQEVVVRVIIFIGNVTKTVLKLYPSCLK